MPRFGKARIQGQSTDHARKHCRNVGKNCKQPNEARLVITPSYCAYSDEERTVMTMADPPNRTDSVGVDELLGMAYDAYERRDYRLRARVEK
jgi:hypothetical protein